MTRRTTAVLVAAAFIVGLLVRCASLGAAGFAEDEVEKYHAATAYLGGHFSVDPEHPMLLKLAIAASLQVVRVWNLATSGWLAPVGDEAAVRLPAAFAGALTVFPLFMLGRVLFGVWVGVGAAWLWALDVNAIAVNRIAKEDTLFVFFLIAAAAAYDYGRAMPRADASRAQRAYAVGSACLGLMLASKYLPHYLGLHFLYRKLAGPPARGTSPDRRLHGVMLAAFLAANFAILFPETVRGVFDYLRTDGGAVGHNGYLFAGTVYSNRVKETPFGIPASFYVTMLATKVPLPVLVLAAVGSIALVTRERARVRAFFAALLLVPLVGYSFFASKFLRYLLPSLALLDLLAALGFAALVASISRLPLLEDGRTSEAPSAGRGSIPAVGPGTGRGGPPGCQATRAVRPVDAALLAVPLVVLLGAGIASSAPYYGLYDNRIRSRANGTDLLFPHCELYDAGLREAVAYVAAHAGFRELVLTDAPRVVREYLARHGRGDLRVAALSTEKRAYPGSWTLVQPGRIYFENRLIVEHLMKDEAPVYCVKIGHHLAVGVYRPGDGSLTAMRRGTAAGRSSAAP